MPWIETLFVFLLGVSGPRFFLGVTRFFLGVTRFFLGVTRFFLGDTRACGLDGTIGWCQKMIKSHGCCVVSFLCRAYQAMHGALFLGSFPRMICREFHDA